MKTLRARKRAFANVVAIGAVLGAAAFWWATRSYAGVAALVLVVAATAVAGWRAGTLRVDFGDDEVVVRNLFRTRRVPRSEVLAWEYRRSWLVSTRWVRGTCPVAVTRSERVTVLAWPEDRPVRPWWARTR